MSKKNIIVGEDMICPITKKHCDDECCPVGSECNMSGDEISDITDPPINNESLPNSSFMGKIATLSYSGYWRDAKVEYPPFEKQVLGVYSITDKNKDVFLYYEIVICESVTESSSGKSSSWRDTDYNSVYPIYWTELPESPIKPK